MMRTAQNASILLALLMMIACPVAGFGFTPQQTSEDEKAEMQTDEEQSDQEEEAAEEEEEIDLSSFDAIKAHWEKVEEAHNLALRAARGDRAKSRELRQSAPSFDDLIEPMMALVENDPTSEESAEMLNWAVFRSRSLEIRGQIIDVMLEHHIESEELLPLIQGVMITDRENGADKLAMILEKNPHDSVRAAVVFEMFTNANKAFAEAEGEEADELKASADIFQEMLSTQYADVKDTRGVTYGSKMETIAFQARLAIGQEVPDIVAEDIDGVEFKLSDYRGKVVVLDFWGDW